MKIVFIIIISVFLVICLFVCWRHYATLQGQRKLDSLIMSQISPIVSMIQSGGPIETDRILDIAKRPETRSTLFRALHEINRPELFPREYSELWQIAESDLVTWLMHPNELGVSPDEIVLAKEIDWIEGNPTQKYRFFIFKFRISPPHWTSDKGWMAGVAGPYWDGELPLVSPPCVFSRFEPFDSATSEEHLKKTEKLLLKVLRRQINK